MTDITKFEFKEHEHVEKQIAEFTAKVPDYVSLTLNEDTVRVLPWVHENFGKNALIVFHPVWKKDSKSAKFRNRELYLRRKDGIRLREQFKEVFGPKSKHRVVFPGEVV